MRLPSLATLIAVSLFSLSTPRAAEACGGCFHEPPGPNEPPMTSVVTGHRMALSVSPEQTVLWDQVEFAGDPVGFAWVLPVGPGATLELSNDAWFDALEGFTRTTIESEVVTCPNGQTFGGGSSGGFGCGASAVDTSDSYGGYGGGGGAGGGSTLSEGDRGPVTVVHQGTVGPYETVTLKATDAQNLRNWLTSHNYAIPTDVDPVLTDYIAQGAEFIALRLQPGAGVRQMQPVRVVTPGASPILPLKMVQAGTGATTSIVLYVIGEGRYGASNFPEAAFPKSKLTWDWTTQGSNYAALRDQALEAGGFMTTFSHALPFSSVLPKPDGSAVYYAAPGQLPVNTLDDLYLSVGASLGLDTSTCHAPTTLLASQEKVVSACTDAACAGAPLASDFACGALDDIGVALTGLHPRDVVLTRLEANLPRNMLDRDLVLGPSSTAGPVANWLVAPENVNQPSCPTQSAQPPPPPTDTTSRSACGCSLPASGGRKVAGLSMIVLALAAAARRAARKTR